MRSLSPASTFRHIQTFASDSLTSVPGRVAASEIRRGCARTLLAVDSE